MTELPLTDCNCGAVRFEVVQGEDRLRTWQPEGGGEKWLPRYPESRHA